MAVKKFNPITPGLRTKIGNAFSELTTDKPEKSLLSPLKKTGGRNSVGRMTMRQKGGGHKRRYRIIDFRRDKDGIPAVVKTIEYDPNRSAFICLLEYADGEKRYIIAPDKIQVGATVLSGKDALPNIGHAMFLSSSDVISCSFMSLTIKYFGATYVYELHLFHSVTKLLFNIFDESGLSLQSLLLIS